MTYMRVQQEAKRNGTVSDTRQSRQKVSWPGISQEWRKELINGT